MPAPVPRPVAGGVVLQVRLTPGARRNAVDGVVRTSDGGAEIRASVTAPPEKGAANAALVAMLAKALRLPKSGIRIVAGATDRRKRLLVEGDSGALVARVEEWLARQGERNG